MHKITKDHKKATILKLALRTEGINVLDNVAGVGNSIKEDVEGLYSIDSKKGIKPNEIVIFNRITTKLVHNEKSRFKLFKDKDEYFVGLDRDTPLINVKFSKRPEHYDLKTERGTPMKNIAQIMGADCLAIAVDKQCSYFNTGDFCRYCNITPTNLQSGIARRSYEEDIKDVIKVAGRKYRFINLTGGTFSDTNKECDTYTEIGNMIREYSNRETYSGPFSLTPPKDLSKLVKLAETGVDVISFNPDVWNQDAFEKLCPGKAKIGKKGYDSALQAAKNIWGESNTVVQYLIGPWESNDDLLDGVKYHLDKGILVNLTTFYPSPKSSLKGTHPKSLSDLVYIYSNYGELVRQSGLFPNARRSILTSESANRSSVSNESSRGYIVPGDENYISDILNEV